MFFLGAYILLVGHSYAAIPFIYHNFHSTHSRTL